MLDLEALFATARPIPSHAILALAALVLGLWQLVGAKGTALHRVMGWLFVGAMAYVAISASFIHSIGLIGPFSPIHLLIPVTLLFLASGVRSARAGRIDAHRRTMRGLVVYALIVTGAFTLLPGRVMHAVVFGG